MAERNIKKTVGKTLRSKGGSLLSIIPLSILSALGGSLIFDNPDSDTGPNHAQSIQQMETASDNLTAQKQRLADLTEQLSFANTEKAEELRTQQIGLSNSFAENATNFMNQIYTDGNLSEEDAQDYYEDLKDIVGDNPPAALTDDMSLGHYEFTHLRDARTESLEQGFKGAAQIQNTKSIMETKGEDFGLLMALFYGIMGGFIGSFGTQAVRNLAGSRRFRDWEDGRSSMPFTKPKLRH